MKLLQFLEALEEKFEKPVVWNNGQFFVAVNNPDNPTFFTAWTHDNKKVATLSTKVTNKKGEPWMAVDYVEVDPKYQRQGIARVLYHVMIDGMSPEYAGLFGYGPDIASQHVSKIYQRYGAHEQEDGHFYIPNPNRGVTETEGDTLKLPDINVGDEMMVGKFKNRRATVKGFKTDKNNHPIAKTDKGDQQIFKGRLKKLMDRATESQSLNKIRHMFEKTLMERFAQKDVDSLYWFWAHPATGKIYDFEGSHTLAATDPEGPIAIDVTQFGGGEEIDIDDYRIFEIAFRAGWVRSHYLPDDNTGNPLGSQVGLHGPDEETVRLTLKMLLDKGLQVDHVGMRGHFDDFEYDEPQ